MMNLNEDVVRNFEVAKVFRVNTRRITGMDFFSDGRRLISCSEDDRIIVYDCANGSRKGGAVQSKRFGAALIHFAESADNVIYSSTKINNGIRHLSLTKKKFTRYFMGHANRVVSLCVSPSKKSFISCSLDETLRLWDFNCKKSVCMLSIPSISTASYDPEGVAVAVGVNSELIKMYDVRLLTKGPFVTFQLNREPECDWTDLKFSPNGRTMLISTNGSSSQLVDAFHGTLLQTFSGHLNNQERISFEASYSPDSNLVFSGAMDGRVHVWNVNSGRKLCVLNGNHPGPVQCVHFNPKCMMFASACTNMAMWLPNKNSWQFTS